MQLFSDLQSLRPARVGGVCMSVGVFDGVHRGHQLLLNHAARRAGELGIKSLALTFRAHPLTLLAPPYAPRFLTTPEQKIRLIEQCGADLCMMVDFTAEFAGITAQRFLEEIVLEGCRARSITCGPDFRFGHKGVGDVKLLRAFCGARDIELDVLETLSDDRAPVRSTRVRQSIQDGRLDLTVRLLGRPYSVTGLVIKGDARGQTIGFPTANLDPPVNQLIPGDGVYAVRVVLDEEGPGGHYDGMLNIGVRPTFENKRRAIEAHLFDFQGDLYGRELTVTFISKMREERRFESVEALIEQLRADEAACRALFDAPGPA